MNIFYIKPQSLPAGDTLTHILSYFQSQHWPQELLVSIMSDKWAPQDIVTGM